MLMAERVLLRYAVMIDMILRTVMKSTLSSAVRLLNRIAIAQALSKS